MHFLSIVFSRLSELMQPRSATQIYAVAHAPIRRISGEEQMGRLAQWATKSRKSSGYSNHCHMAAEDQLDAAAYALKELLGDLSKVMAVPQIRFGAELYVLSDPSAPAPARNTSARMLQQTL